MCSYLILVDLVSRADSLFLEVWKPAPPTTKGPRGPANCLVEEAELWWISASSSAVAATATCMLDAFTTADLMASTELLTAARAAARPSRD